MSKCIKKIFQVLLDIVITLMVIITIFIGYNLIQTKILNKDYCDFFGYTVFQVATGSMSNTIEVGDIIAVEIKNDDIKENDIIVFKQDNYVITHRVIKIDENSIVTKGDANNAEDKPITKDNVIGKVIKILPNIAIWAKVFKTPKVIISIFITLILFLLAFSIKSKEKETDTIKEEDKQ